MKKIGVGTFSADSRTRELVNEVLDSNRISYGPMCKRFEKEFSELHECKYGVLSNSGTSSLHVALQTLKEIHNWEDDTEVIVPSLTFVATINVVLHNRMKPVLVDVDPSTYNMSVELIEKAITKNTRAIIPVHLFGQSADMQGIMYLAHRYGLKVIEDSCECMFAKHRDKSVGSWGDIACFSMYVAHLISTGVGGIAVTNNPEYAAKMRSLVNHGRDGIYIDMDTKSSPEVINRRFRFESIGHSFRITELEAALGLAQLENHNHVISTRQRLAKELVDELSCLKNDGLRLPYIEDFNTHSFMMFPIVLVCHHQISDDKAHCDCKQRVCHYLERNGIETRDMLPITNQVAYTGMWDVSNYPVANWINQCGFYIGCHQDMDSNDIKYIAEKITDTKKIWSLSHV